MSASAAQAPGGAVPLHATRRRTTISFAYGLVGVLLLAYVALKIFDVNHYRTLVDGWIVAGFELLASGLCLIRGLVRQPGRGVALALGVGLSSWTVGQVALTVESLGGATPSVPSLADGFYLGFFPFAFLAVVLLMRGGTRAHSTPRWLDGAVAGLAAAALCAAFAFPNLGPLAGGGSLAVTTAIAYPVGDLLLFFLVVGGSAMLCGRGRTPWWLFAAAAAINVAGDGSNFLGSAFGATHLGTVFTAVSWPTALLLMSMAVWARPRSARPLASQKSTGLVLPGVAALSAVGILVFAALHHTGRVAIELASATLIVVGIRLALSARTLRALTTKRYRQSMTDDLTGLGNRRHLFQILDAFFADEAAGASAGRRMAFLFLDLNNFKALNDSFGHSAGDAVLKQLGARLKASLRESDELVRVGGDEFAVVLADADAEYATTVAASLTAGLREPFDLDAVSPRIGASIGIAEVPAHATDIPTLMWCADVAMYRAKNADSPYAVFSHKQDFDGDGNRLRLAEELRAAISGGQLVLHYQPQLNLRSDEISTVEALVRWAHPRLGMVPPLKFIPVAEEAGLMGPLTEWVMEHAFEQCAAWRTAGRRMSVSVNVSATNLLQGGFVELVAELLERCDLPADAVILEITETSIITEFERSKRVIEKLRDLGLVVSIDDFGAGFTSLAYLGSLAVGELKLDRAFISRLASGGREREVQLVHATIDLGHALGLRVVAEGVEDYPTLALLSRCGCDLVQGYFIDLPRPAEELTFLQRAQGSTAPDGVPLATESAPQHQSAERPSPPYVRDRRAVDRRPRRRPSPIATAGHETPATSPNTAEPVTSGARAQGN